MSERATARRALSFGWGFLDQAASSATNLLLTLAGARVLGAHGLGVVAVGFTAYLLLLGVQRALVSQPLVVSTAASDPVEARAGTRGALTIAIGAAGLSGLALLGLGFAIGGTVGHAMLLFAPWMPAALLQDLWRAVLFRDSRGAAASANDLLWLAVMVPSLAGAWVLGSDWAVVGAWGAGAWAGALLGFRQVRLWADSPTSAIGVWRRDLWPFGRWLLGSSLVYNVSTQTTVFVVGALLGAADLGGLRVVQTAFAPLTLLLPAVALPSLPIMTRRLSATLGGARSFAITLSGALTILTGVYVLAVGIGGRSVLSAVFGHSFVRYGILIVPIAIQQVFTATGAGFEILLRARKAGHALFLVQASAGAAGIAAVALAASLGELFAVGWSLAASTGLMTCMLVYAALCGPKPEGGRSTYGKVDVIPRSEAVPRL